MLLDRLQGVRRTGDGKWIARCPAHADKRASLSVRALADGRVLVHCFASCSVAEVLKAVNMNLEDLFPPRAPADGHRAQRVRRPYSDRDLALALRAELNLVWVLLGDVAAGKVLTEADRKRAALARTRCAAVLGELCANG
jgi:hypothetical protein